MEAHKTQHESLPSAATPAATSCRRKKNEQATLLEDLKDRIDDFLNASMDEHKTCFKKNMQKVCSPFTFKANTAYPQMFLMFNWFASDSDWIILHSFSDVWNVKACCWEECRHQGSWEYSAPSNHSGKIEHLLLRFIGRYLENQTLLPALTN